jgi:CRP-like cAMP-binding protein
VRINQADLANIVGCSRQSVNRKLAELRDEGLITMGKGGIKVLARDRLETRVK